MFTLNRYQLSFLATFLFTFSSLYLFSTYVGKILAEAGYDISQLILIGLPKNHPSDYNETAESSGRAPMQKDVIPQIAALGMALLSGLYLLKNSTERRAYQKLIIATFWI